MKREEYKKIKEIFQSALDVEVVERPRFLDEKCSNNPALRREVERMLDSYDSGYLEEPALERMAQAVANDRLESGQQIGHYKIIKKIGAGGMGEVFLAEDLRLHRKIALKVLPDSLAFDNERLRRFKQEAFAASALNHPNILTIYEFGDEDGTHFLASEYVEGETLRELMNSGELDLIQSLHICEQIAFALSAAHAGGIAHRDLKPENVMVRADGIVKVLDFGLAKLLEKKIVNTVSEDQTTAFKTTNPGVIMGTISYMSPEQARGKATDERTDIWSLGVMIYELLTGRVPFADETSSDVIAAILTKEPQPLTEFSGNTPEELQRIVGKTLQKKREERYQHIKDLRIDLKDLRRRLEFGDKLDNSVSPNRAEQKTQIMKATTVDELNQTTNETRNDSITIRKSRIGIAAIGALAVLIISAIGLYWFYPRTDKKQIESIAVMPFVNESGNQDIEYLSDGMTDTLINSLSKLPDLNVKASEIVFRYKGKEMDSKKLASELNVQAILTGRIRQNGDQIILNLYLMDAQTQNVLWGNRYERKQSELIGLQSDIARDLTNDLRAKLSGADKQKATDMGTTNLEAYEAYLKGDYYFRENFWKNHKKVIEQFQIAIDKDPNYARAYAALANTYINLFSGDGEFRTKEAFLQPKALAEKALSLDPTLAQPHSTLGSVNVIFWKWAEAEKEYKQAIELEPNYPNGYAWYSSYLNTQGRHDEALTMMKRAQELDPSNLAFMRGVSAIYNSQKNYQASIDNSLKILELNPNQISVYSSLAGSYLGLGRKEEAVAAAEKLAKEFPENSNIIAVLGYFYAAVGKRDKALAMIKELEKKYSKKEATGLDLATVYAPLGDKDKAFEWLEKDFRDKTPGLEIINYQTPYENLRDDPRYKDLLRRMNMPE